MRRRLRVGISKGLEGGAGWEGGGKMTSLSDQSMPISSAASKSLALVEMIPWLPTPHHA